MDKFDQFTDWAIELQSLAQAGLTYGHDKSDLERYQRIREIATEMMTKKQVYPQRKLEVFFVMILAILHLKLIPVQQFLKMTKSY